MRRRFNPWVGKTPWRRAWQPTPVFLPGEFHGQRSLAGYSPQGRTESDTTEAIQHTCMLQQTSRMAWMSQFLFNARDPKNKAGHHLWDGQRCNVWQQQPGARIWATQMSMHCWWVCDWADTFHTNSAASRKIKFLPNISATLPVRTHLAQVLTNYIWRHAHAHTHMGVYFSHVYYWEKLGLRGN